MQRYELFCIIQNIKHIISKKVHIMSFHNEFLLHKFCCAYGSLCGYPGYKDSDGDVLKVGEIDDFGFICAKSFVLGCNFVQDIGAAGQLPECSLGGDYLRYSSVEGRK